MVLYQWEEFIKKHKPKKKLSSFHPGLGYNVISRRKGKANKIQFTVLADHKAIDIYLVGNFNNWGKTNNKFDERKLTKWKLQPDFHGVYHTITVSGLKHKEKYKFLVKNGSEWDYRRDPAGTYFDEEGNSIIWDYDDPSAYKQKHKLIDTINRPTKIIQTDLPGLISHWRHKKTGKLGRDIPEKETYKFFATSGIIEHVKQLGFNTIQFLPFHQSIDGDNWKFRYLVLYQYAIQNKWGNPDDFARMIDACHKQDIAVIGDFVVSHAPCQHFKIFGESGAATGIHKWRSKHGKDVFLADWTPWGTKRFDYDNHHVRKFLVEGCLHFMKRYNIDGFRIDNVDGIIRYGDAGEGPERPNGRTFLREMTKVLYEYNPYALAHFESHYFYGDNAKMLVVPLESDPRALGATAYNSSRVSYYLHKELMPKSAEHITPFRFEDIRSEKEWGQCNSTVGDFHNHDAAAGLMHGRATGSYAYDALILKRSDIHFHAVGKIKIMEALISFGLEGRTLDLIQSFLLQTGTFEHDSSVHWFLEMRDATKGMLKYKQDVNKLMDDPAFWPMNTKNRKYINVDDVNKMLAIVRKDTEQETKSEYLVNINFSSRHLHNYAVGVEDHAEYEVVLNGDLYKYAGQGMVAYPNTIKTEKSDKFELFDKQITLNDVAPYGVVVLKKVK